MMLTCGEMGTPRLLRRGAPELTYVEPMRHNQIEQPIFVRVKKGYAVSFLLFSLLTHAICHSHLADYDGIPGRRYGAGSCHHTSVNA